MSGLKKFIHNGLYYDLYLNVYSQRNTFLYDTILSIIFSEQTNLIIFYVTPGN